MVEDTKVLIIGNGAREHVISEAYEKSKGVKKIIVAPGNDFICYKRKKEVLIDENCSLKDPNSLLRIALKYKPDLIDVAQDDALALGTVDLLKGNGFCVFGPTKNAARIESDKFWSRIFMQRHNIPTPKFINFESKEDAEHYLSTIYALNPNRLLFIKATGLCSGKGALRATNLKEAMKCVREMEKFGDAGKNFLVEEALIGEEFSYYAISDSLNYKFFKPAQDHKTVFDFDEGPQTGGMGSICPSIAVNGIEEEVKEKLIASAIKGLNLEGIPYIGILYLGGIVVNKKPINIEYNARWGDPECQVVLPSLKNDYFELVTVVLEKKLENFDLIFDDRYRVCLVGAAKGYPNNHSNVNGKKIYGLEDIIKIEGISLYGSGIKIDNGNFYVNGGRLFSVVATGNAILEAKNKAYSAISLVSIEGNNLHYRTDIGHKDLKRLNKTKNL